MAKVEIAVPVFGYKTHVSIDRTRGLVRRFTVTSAAAHDRAQHRFGLFVRTIGLARARTEIGLANSAYDLKRFLCIEAQPVAA